MNRRFPPSSLPFDFQPRAPSPSEPPAKVEPPRALSVGELGRALKRSLEGAFESPVWVEGEVTGARPVTSGHVYFAFKDEREEASIDVAIYKASVTPRMRTMIVDGARLRLRGKPSFWAPRGRVQFAADRAEPVGRGALLEALERLKTKLAAEGLFDPRDKRPIPEQPRIIGVVTSKTGAVIHDICKVAFRRGSARILLAPALVQGAGAAASVVRALALLSSVRGVDVIIVGRGGGSADDLATFNDEQLVRAVARCPVPVISAVGHEVDITLTDFAADARAATPSQAAELVVPDVRARLQALRHNHARLVRATEARVHRGARQLDAAQRRLGDPRLALASFQQTLDDRLARLVSAVRRPAARSTERLLALDRRLGRVHPSVRLSVEARTLVALEVRLATHTRALVARRERRLRELVAGLDAMSPLQVLKRGYAIATTEMGRAVRSAEDVQIGEALGLRVAHGRLSVRVLDVEPEPSLQPNDGAEARDPRRP